MRGGSVSVIKNLLKIDQNYCLFKVKNSYLALEGWGGTFSFIGVSEASFEIMLVTKEEEEHWTRGAKVLILIKSSNFHEKGKDVSMPGASQ